MRRRLYADHVRFDLRHPYIERLPTLYVGHREELTAVILHVRMKVCQQLQDMVYNYLYLTIRSKISINMKYDIARCEARTTKTRDYEHYHKILMQRNEHKNIYITCCNCVV